MPEEHCHDKNLIGTSQIERGLKLLILRVFDLLANDKSYEGRKRVLAIMASILTAIHMPTACDVFGTPAGSPESDKLISASVQWARKIMEKIDRSLSDSP